MNPRRVVGAMDVGSFRNKVWSGACIGWVGLLLLCGCAPEFPRSAEEQREAHFVLGERRVAAGNYPGAIQAFEQSLDVNPHSAAAHFELGRLYDGKAPAPALAIYHYDCYLKLRPDAGDAGRVKQRIEVCKQELAVNVLGLPDTPIEQRQLEQVMAKNRRLRGELNHWRARCAALMTVRARPAAAGSRFSAPGSAVHTGSTRPMIARAHRFAPARIRARRRTCAVTAGETAIGIARHYRLSLEALLEANPGLKPRRMTVGEVLHIPSPVRHDSAAPDVAAFLPSGGNDQAGIAGTARDGF